MVENNLGYKYLRKQLEKEKRIERFYRENKSDFFTWGCVIFGLLFLLIYGINF